MSKNLFFTFIGILTLNYSYSKEPGIKIKHHEIGLNLYSFTNLYSETINDWSYGTELPQQSFVNGLLYKYHFKRSALRVSFGYQKHVFPVYEKNGNIQEGEYYNGEISNKELRVGYERNLGSKKLKPYLAIEAIYSKSFNDGKPFCSRCDEWPYDVGLTTLGVMPSIGGSYQFNKWLSIRIETSASFAAFQNEWVLWNGNKSYYSDLGGVFIFNPISTFSLNVHF